MLPASGAHTNTTDHPVSRSSGFKPGKPNSGIGVERSLPRDFRKVEEPGSHDRANRMTTDILSPGVAAAVAIKPCRGFDRAYIKRFPEHVAYRSPPTASVLSSLSIVLSGPTIIPARRTKLRRRRSAARAVRTRRFSAPVRRRCVVLSLFPVGTTVRMSRPEAPPVCLCYRHGHIPTPARPDNPS